MKDFGAKTWMYPMPAFVIGTYGPKCANAMTAAWGIICNMEPPCMEFYLDAGHKTVANIREKLAFTASPATVATLAQADYVGLVHGHSIDKVAACGLHDKPAPHVNAPVFAELPMAIECSVTSIAESGDCIRVYAKIVNICADESILDASGNIDPVKLRPIVYDPVNSVYYELGSKVGNAFSDGKKFF